MMTRGQANAILAEILQPINQSVGMKESPFVNHTFGQFVERVYIPVYKGKWKVSTAMTELDRLNHHLVGSLGERVMSAITRDELQKLLDRKAKALSESVVTHLRFRLRSVFDLAVSEGAVQRNPASTLYTPKFCKAGRTKRVLTPEDLDAMTKALDFREQIILRLATFEGMRPGEVLGLQRGDVDFAEECLWVRRRVYKTDVDSPKSDRSTRQVALSEGTVELLKKWFDWMICTDELAWVFSTENSKRPLTRDFIWTKRMLPFLKPIGLDWATFQVMRRTHASRSKEAGVDAHTRSAQMGNTVDVNENEYAVSDFKTRREAVRKLEAALTVKVKDNGESSE
jgi:integrase